MLCSVQVWDVLTDYERLPEFAPNLLVSERIKPPSGAPRRIKRLRQVDAHLARILPWFNAFACWKLTAALW